MFSRYEGRSGISDGRLPSDRSPSSGCGVSGGGSGGRGLSSGGGLLIVG